MAAECWVLVKPWFGVWALQHLILAFSSCDSFLRYLQIAREVLDAAARVIRPGITTDEIDSVVHETTIASGMIHIPHISYHISLSGEELLSYDVIDMMLWWSYRQGAQPALYG